jgi:hypothetical protein
MLKKKIIGLLISTGEELSISQISDLTNEKKEVLLIEANKLVKENKAYWNTKEKITPHQ